MAEDLPKAIVKRVVKDKLSQCSKGDGDFNLHKEALTAFSESARIFIHYLSATANDICRGSKRQTINAEDVLKALEDIEFPELVDPLQELREKNAGKKSAAATSKAKDAKRKEEAKTKEAKKKRKLEAPMGDVEEEDEPEEEEEDDEDQGKIKSLGHGRLPYSPSLRTGPDKDEDGSNANGESSSKERTIFS